MILFLIIICLAQDRRIAAHEYNSESIIQPLGQWNGNIFTIRLLIMSDRANYKRWVLRSDNNEAKAEKNMKFYFGHIIDGNSINEHPSLFKRFLVLARKLVNQRYRNLRIFDRSFKVVITGFHFIKGQNENRFIDISKVSDNLIDGSRAILAMREWLKISGKELKEKYKHDAIVLFTSNNIDGLSGVAFKGSICSSTSAGIIRDFGIFENIDTTTHELGHILGSLHDGEQNNCDPGKQYIMSTVRRRGLSKNIDHFSSCSIFSIQLNLKRLQKYKCLERNADTSREVTELLQIKPGMKLTPDDQCQLMYGLSSYYCGGGGKLQEDICRDMLCWNANTRHCVATTRQRAADGTPCGDKMWCLEGQCVQSSSAPKNSLGKCLYGDFREFSYTVGKSCEAIRQTYPWFCYKNVTQAYCCRTCANLRKKSRPGCEYGDKDSGCSKGVCHDQNWKNKCCKTCYEKGEVVKEKDRECPDGDLASWCPSQSKSFCYNNNKTCCSTCRKYYNATARGCEYGDKQSWCPSHVAGYPEECLLPETPCCESCATVKRRKQKRRRN